MRLQAPRTVSLPAAFAVARAHARSEPVGGGAPALAVDAAGKVDELPRLQARHANVLRFFIRVKDKDDLDACVAVLEPEDIRAQFDDAFEKFGQSLDMLPPDPKALPYVGDAKWLGKVRQVAAAKFCDDKIDISDCGAKVRKLIEEAVSADGIQILVKQVSLFSPQFSSSIRSH